MKSRAQKIPEKFPLLRCPDCGYEYRPNMSGWAFRTDKNTKCIGLPTIEEVNPTDAIPVSRMPAFHHPFQVVEEN